MLASLIYLLVMSWLLSLLCPLLSLLLVVLFGLLLCLFPPPPPPPPRPTPRSAHAAAENRIPERALDIAVKVYGPEHADVATYLNNLARVLKAQVSVFFTFGGLVGYVFGVDFGWFWLVWFQFV